MTLPRKVIPAKTAEFTATRWENTAEDDNSVQWMADQFGWTVKGVNNQGRLIIWGRNRRHYQVREGDWVIALGTNGSIRVCSDKQYRQDYREASE